IDLINELPSRNLHIPGAGVGGHCLPKDTWLLRFGLNEYGTHKMEPRFIALARDINNHMPFHMALLIEDALGSKGLAIHDANVTILGAAYLENSDDTRNTPAAALVSVLESKGANVTIHDPHVKEWEFGDHKMEQDLNVAVKGADCLALVTRHREYIGLDLKSIRGLMRNPVFVDGRNVLVEDDAISMGFEYRAVGKAGIKNH
ncbi:MAG: UDP binding domain-containing protein, partial [Candidatus Thorarchaeota archaeon]